MVFLDDPTGKANVILEPNVKLITAQIDFLLLDGQGYLRWFLRPRLRTRTR
jgi:hypothetical protein